MPIENEPEPERSGLKYSILLDETFGTNSVAWLMSKKMQVLGIEARRDSRVWLNRRELFAEGVLKLMKP